MYIDYFFLKISLFCALRRFIHISILDNNLFLWFLICSELLYAGLHPGTQWSPLKNGNMACGGCMGGLRELRAEIFVPQGTSNMNSCIRRTSKYRRSHSSGTGGRFTDLILSYKNRCPSVQEDWIKLQCFQFSLFQSLLPTTGTFTWSEINNLSELLQPTYPESLTTSVILREKLYNVYILNPTI